MKAMKVSGCLVLVMAGQTVRVPSGAPHYAEVLAASEAGNERLVKAWLGQDQQRIQEAVQSGVVGHAAGLTVDDGAMWYAPATGSRWAVAPALAQGHQRAALVGYGFGALAAALARWPVTTDFTQATELLNQAGTYLSGDGLVMCAVPEGACLEDVVELLPSRHAFEKGVERVLVDPASLHREARVLRGRVVGKVPAATFFSPLPGRLLAPYSALTRIEGFDGMGWQLLGEGVPLLRALDQAEAAVPGFPEVRVTLSDSACRIWVGASAEGEIEVWEGHEGTDQEALVGRYPNLALARLALTTKTEGDEGSWIALRRRGDELVRKEFFAN